MKLYLASVMDMNPEKVLDCKYNLQTFWGLDTNKKKIVNMIIENNGNENFILDSGAFSMFSGSVKGLNYNFLKKYIDDYCFYIKRNNIENFIEMDIDAIIGYDNVKKIRKYITEKVGRKPIEVWHTWRGDEDFIRACKENDYICIGIRKKTGMKETFQYLINQAKEYDCKVHILGWTPLYLEEIDNIYSCDSTSWLSGGRFSSIYHFENDKMIHTHKPEGTMRKDDTDAYMDLNNHNLNQWLKYQSFLVNKGWDKK